MNQPVQSLTLDHLPIGQLGRITRVEGDDALFVRLLELGFVRGVAVEVIKRAPLGDPLELQLRGYHVSLRAREASRVHLERRA